MQNILLSLPIRLEEFGADLIHLLERHISQQTGYLHTCTEHLRLNRQNIDWNTLNKTNTCGKTRKKQ